VRSKLARDFKARGVFLEENSLRLLIVVFYEKSDNLEKDGEDDGGQHGGHKHCLGRNHLQTKNKIRSLSAKEN
jgi:hypothetical protein